MPFTLPIERLFGGKPLITPTGNGWESGVTFNSAAVFLEPTDVNERAFTALLGEGSRAKHPNGIAVLHYRARPKNDQGFPWTRSYVGVAIYEPDLTLIRRYENPVVSPGEMDDEVDSLGVEDPRVTYLDGAWWMVYCGVSPLEPLNPLNAWRGSICMARSEDLVTWTKLGAVRGMSGGFEPLLEDPSPPPRVNNKDGVLFPDRIGGKVYLLHRPMVENVSENSVHIAVADDPAGPFEDLGFVHAAMRSSEYIQSWVGAGSVPISLGNGRYVSIEHTGNYLPKMQRKYVLDAFLYDFNRLEAGRPESVLVARMDDIMRPETDYEINSPFLDSVANVVFACGSYVQDGWLYLVYGGGDSFILAARLRFDVLVESLEKLASG